MRSRTVREAAAVGGCSISTIRTLLHTGKLHGEQPHGPAGHWRVHATEEQIREAVPPRCGYTHTRRHADPRRAEAAPPSPPVQGGLTELRDWLNLSPAQRTILLRLGKLPTADLELLEELANTTR